METESLKSPLLKLVKFFRRSRDGWKAKCQRAKRQNKALFVQSRAVERSRNRWKAVARESRQQIRRLLREVEELKQTACGIGA